MPNRGFICVVGLLGSTEDKELTDFAIFNFIDINGPFVHGGLSVLSVGTLLISFFPIVSKL